MAATIKRRIERHDERIEAFFDSIGQEPTLTLFPRERPNVGLYASCQRDVPNPH